MSSKRIKECIELQEDIKRACPIPPKGSFGQKISFEPSSAVGKVFTPVGAGFGIDWQPTHSDSVEFPSFVNLIYQRFYIAFQIVPYAIIGGLLISMAVSVISESAGAQGYTILSTYPPIAICLIVAVFLFGPYLGRAARN